MTGQGGVAVLLIIALTTVTTVTGAGPIPLTQEELDQRDDAMAEIANLPLMDQMELPAGPVFPLTVVQDCHAHGDIRYVTLDGLAFRFDTWPWDIGIMARPLNSWFWYIMTKHEFFDGGPKTRLSAVKFKIFDHYVIIEYKKNPDPAGLYNITVGQEFGPVLWVGFVGLGPGTVGGEIHTEGGFKIAVILIAGDWYIEVRSTHLPAVLFDMWIRVARHCLQIHLPPIWSGLMEGICGDWDGLPWNDVVALDAFPQVTSKPFPRFP